MSVGDAVEVVDRERTHIDDALDACGDRTFEQIAGSIDVDPLVHRPPVPFVRAARKVEDHIDPFARRCECRWIGEIRLKVFYVDPF